MAQSILNWTVGGGGNSTGQQVQYKAASSPTWIVHSTVGPLVTTATVTGLLDNTIYDFRIVNICSDGGPTPSAAYQSTSITCPVVTYTDHPTSIDYTFPNLGADVSRYVVHLLDATGTNVLQTKTHNLPFASNVSESFTGLTPSTNYGVRVTVYVGGVQQYSRTCAVANRTTAAPNVCNAPSNVVAEMSSGA